MIAKSVFCGFISANGKTVDNIFTEKQMSYMFYSFYVDVSDISQQLIFGIFGQFTKTKQHETSDNIYRVRIIGSHFANYKVNSIYCKVVNQKLWSRFFPKEILICPNHIFHITSLFHSSIACYYQKKYCLYPKLHHKMQKLLHNSQKKPFSAVAR